MGCSEGGMSRKVACALGLLGRWGRKDTWEEHHVSVVECQRLLALPLQVCSTREVGLSTHWLLGFCSHSLKSNRAARSPADTDLGSLWH